MSRKPEIFSFSSYTLKYIALSTMTLDHIAAILLPYGSPIYTILRGIGRIAFPLYCFLLVEGYLHTSNRASYFRRLLIFAVLSEIPFDMALFHFPIVTSPSSLFSHQNVFFTLAFGFLAMYLLDYHWYRNRSTGFIFLMFIGILSEIFYFDYGLSGIIVLTILFIGRKFRSDIKPIIITICSILPLFSPGSISGVCVTLALPFILFYNGRKGSPLPNGKSFPGAKYLFYIYYPAHLFIISLVYFIIHYVL